MLLKSVCWSFVSVPGRLLSIKQSRKLLVADQDVASKLVETGYRV